MGFSIRLLPLAQILTVYAAILGQGAWADNPTSAVAGRSCNYPKSDLVCMACNIYYESRGEPYAGMVEVGKTVMSRVASKFYPKSVCQVVYQRPVSHHKVGAWQFSWVGERRKAVVNGQKRGHVIEARLPKSGDVLARVEKAARAAMAAGPSGATRYYADYISRPRDLPRDCNRTSYVGHHQFFHCPEDLTPFDVAMGRFEDAQKYGHVAHPRIDADGLPMPVPRPESPAYHQYAQAQQAPKPQVVPVISKPVQVSRPVQEANLDDEPGIFTDSAR